MVPFLQQVVQYYLEAQCLEDYCFVFPNRRSGQFFTHYLQRALVGASKGKPVPHLLPHVTSINELLAELTGTVAATDIEMMFALYDAYCKAMGDAAQEFDKFIYWAQLIIGDFNDIDKSLADAADIYQNLSDLHGLVANFLTTDVEEKVKRIFGEGLFTAFFDTSAEAALWQQRTTVSPPAQGNTDPDDVKQKFMSLWNALADIYVNYHQTLDAKRVVSPGRQLRMAAENPPAQLRYNRLIFVGFGVLSAAEMKLFDHFKNMGKADFWWDTAGIKAMLEASKQDPGAQLIDGYCKHFDAKPIEPVNNEGQTLRVVAVPSMVGQAKVAFDEVALMPGAKSSTNLDTAIVLPDESLLIPLLHAVPPTSLINVTLGYPLRNSGIVSLMHIVARMHHQASKERKGWTYYREDVNDILSHPLIKTFFTSEALDKATELARTNRFRVPADELVTLSFGDLFAPAMDSDQQGSDSELRASYLDRLLAFSNLLMAKMQNAPVGDEDEDDEKEAVLPLQQAFLLMYIDVLNQLKRSLDECGQTLQRSSVFFLIDRLTASSIVAFTGEPLQGLQVMGLLETRSLDFKHVVVLSMNERVFPRRHGINSFIPNYMRRAHGMSTIEQQEAIMAYNFFRLLNRAENVTMIYDSSTQNATASSEPSRYITQLEIIYGKKLEHIEKSLVVQKSSSVKIQVPNTSDIDLEDRYTRNPEHDGGKYLSASAINKHINCPLNFYLHYVQGLNDDNELSDFMDSSTFGTIIHDTLNDCYMVDSAKGHTFTRDEIVDFKKRRLKPTVERYIRKHYMHVPDDELDSNLRPITGDALMLIDTIISYVGFVLDYDLDLIDREGPFTVLECEETHTFQPLKLGKVEFNFSFKPDRVDRLANGMVRIVDYKTGKDVTGYSSINDLFDNKASKGRRKAILQLFLYCYAYLCKHPELEAVMPVIYKVASMKESGVLNGKNGQYVFSLQDSQAMEFIGMMQDEVDSIYHKDFIQAPEGSSTCNYCRFIDFCRRTPVVYRK